MSRPVILDLPHGRSTTIDEGDLSLAGDLTLYVGANGYVYYSTWENGKSVPRTLHGLLMRAPSGTHVDHVNGDKLDNRRSNLRITSPQLNQVNRKRLNRNNTSGTRGVGRRAHLSAARPWLAQITVNRKNVYLGVFATQEEALAARRVAELEHFGELCP